MNSNDFASLAAVQVPSPSRLLASACCPDKDLLILVSRLGGHDRMSLWKMQGSKTWEIDVSADSERIVGVTWSPDGQTIAVAHDPPSITLHSIQNGRSERVISIPISDKPIPQLTDIWWFHQEQPDKSPIPDIFKRNGIITGSAHSVLRMLPLLDQLRDDTKQLTATDLFAFQGSQTTARRVAPVPDVIKSWPTLQPDPVSASINVQNTHRTAENGITDEVDTTNLDSILAVADSSGHLSCFLDGTYPLGSLKLGNSNTTSVASLFKNPKSPILLAHPVYDGGFTDLLPTHVSLSLLQERNVRDFAKLSTTARELCWYILRVVEEMRAAWAGSDTTTGARELGPKWIATYESKQKDDYHVKPTGILDLTTLLVTDRPSEALADYLGSGPQMSERGMQKWDSTVTEALIKLRDYSEKRFVPACQRLHLVLGEVRGWASMPSLYTALKIPSETVDQCITMLNQAILLGSWLAAAARREHNRFKEFMTWLRYETVLLGPSSETPNPTPLRHDILEVNQYLMSGLEKSMIDKWFMGPVPTFVPQDLGIPGYDLTVRAALQRAHEYLNLRDPSETPVTVPLDGFNDKSFESIERNLSALIGAFANSCREVFDRPSAAATRAAAISASFGSALGQTTAVSYDNQTDLLTRDRTTVDTSREDGYYVQYLVMYAPSASSSEHRSFVNFVRQRYGHNSSHVEVAVHECCLRRGEEESVVGVDLLALEFFDDETIVIVYRTGEAAYIGTLSYRDLEYADFQPAGYVRLSRESLIKSVLQDLNAGQLRSSYLPIKQSRGLKGCRSGSVSLAVNGRVGRRVACVLDSKGTTLETFDLEGDEEGEEHTTLDEER
ncbi:anaphase-promoting complex, cyclosome, subunit 4-domain-containing protein [Lentinula aciculospora]|uniref:Anaphase-promoting complex subunit 4 n=1 Tax=Lentinula aciculospora TaxID=153920 RepID=A0A9W9DUR7_9AGAR|nr:anaphase-promoting complex, cyclosome, subunit 4-domain-containing protein [Lentinula aciculospora]